MKKIIENNYKILIGIIIGSLISGVGVYAVNEILASNVTYTPSDSSWKVNNTASALDNLYDYYETSKYVERRDCVQGTFVCTDCTTSEGQKILDFAPTSIWFVSKTGDKWIMHFDKSIDLNNFHTLYLDPAYSYNYSGTNYNMYQSYSINDYYKINDNLVIYNALALQNQEIYFMACK